MTPKSLLAILGLALIVVTAGYLHVQRDRATTARVESTSSSKSQTQSNDQTTITAAPLPHLDSAPDSSVSERSDSPRKFVIAPSGERVQVETVEGIEFKKNRNCTVRIVAYTTTDDGTNSPVYSCEPDEPKPVDIYTTYTTAELEVLAYSDAHAGFILARRLHERNFTRALDYGLRSAALSGDPKAIVMLTALIPPYASDDYAMKLKYIEERYVLSGVTQALDRSNRLHTRVAQQAKIHQGDGINIVALDARIANHLQTIEDIQREVGIK